MSSSNRVLQSSFSLVEMHLRTLFRCSCQNFMSSVTLGTMIPVIVQPVLVLFVMLVIPNNIPLIALTIGIALLISIHLAKHDLRSHLLYYWIVLSISYTIIVFEIVIVPLAEIEPLENFVLVLLTMVSMFFLYLTTAATSNNKSELRNGYMIENRNGESMNGNGCVSICPACRVKMHLRNYHCHVCNECIPKYDHHCYWLNCCIGDVNLHFFVAGIFFGVIALTLASMLILTSICSPEFKFGVLLPEDCTDVCENIEMCTSLVCGIYCLELAVILLLKVVQHLWLISRGFSFFEWRENYKYSFCHPSPYSYGFRQNWMQFFKKFKNIHL